MNNNALVIARKYAQAFFNVYIIDAHEQHYQNLVCAWVFLSARAHQLLLLDTMLLDKQQKMNCMDKILSSYDIFILCKPLIKLLIHDNRLSLIVLVLQSIIKLYENHHNILAVTATSAVTLSQEQCSIIQKFLSKKTKKNILLTLVVDAQKLIAGIQLKSATYCWEYSIAQHVGHMRTVLSSQGISCR